MRDSMRFKIGVGLALAFLIAALDFWSDWKFRKDMREYCAQESEYQLTQAECDAIVNIIIEDLESR